MSYHPPPRLLKGFLGVSLGLWVLLGSCAVWSGTAEARLNRDLVEAAEEGVRGVMAPRSSTPKHSFSLLREAQATAGVPGRVEVEVIGGWRQVGVAYPKVYGWLARRAEDGGRVLTEGAFEAMDKEGDVIVLLYFPLHASPATPDGRDLESVVSRGLLPSDVAAFARRKLAESQ